MSEQETAVKQESTEKEMGAVARIIGIFSSPKETFQSIDRKPTWLVPFIITIIFVTVYQFVTMDIGMADRMAMMEARGTPAEQMQMAEQQMAGPMKYIGFAIAPIATLAFWAILAGILLFGGNTIMGGDSKFKKMFALVSWSSLVGIVGGLLKMFLILQKGTTHGITTSLAILVPTPPIGETPPILYRILTKFDLFTIWNLVLWVIGLSVIYKFTTKKSATLVITLQVIWIIISVALGGLFANFGM
jgi:hypothetical protein